MAQLAILAAYAIVLTAALIVDHRRLDTALLRSRGAGPLQVGGAGPGRGAPARGPRRRSLGPWLAAAALRLFNVAGPAGRRRARRSSRRSTPTPTSPPARRRSGARRCSSCRRSSPRARSPRSSAGRSRQETRPLGQRLGLDIALLAITAVGALAASAVRRAADPHRPGQPRARPAARRRARRSASSRAASSRCGSLPLLAHGRGARDVARSRPRRLARLAPARPPARCATRGRRCC